MVTNIGGPDSRSIALGHTVSPCHVEPLLLYLENIKFERSVVPTTVRCMDKI